jgi:hypothetical protein
MVEICIEKLRCKAYNIQKIKHILHIECIKRNFQSKWTIDRIKYAAQLRLEFGGGAYFDQLWTHEYSLDM